MGDKVYVYLDKSKIIVNFLPNKITVFAKVHR